MVPKSVGPFKSRQAFAHFGKAVRRPGLRWGGQKRSAAYLLYLSCLVYIRQIHFPLWRSRNGQVAARRPKLWHVSASDPGTLGGLAALKLITGATACWIPAGRA
jgi:hypothetical protein